MTPMPHRSAGSVLDEKKPAESKQYWIRVALDTGAVLDPFGTLEEARAFSTILAVFGYRAYDEEGEVVHLPYPRLACDILREAKRITNYVRAERFSYGHAPLNPSMNHEAHIVSCDRLVDWVLYNVGFTDQPLIHGKCVSGPGLTDWCIQQGFAKIGAIEAMQPGDIVFTRPNEQGDPLHTFIHAGHAQGRDHYRYDCGSDERIQSVQPFLEPIEDFMYAYRPIVKGE